MLSRDNIYAAVKWSFAIAAYAYLGYKLISLDNYGEILEAWKAVSAERYAYLFPVLLLLPVNLYLEAWKWKKIVQNAAKISIWEAQKAVLAGICSGFFTPYRIGNFVGRIRYLPPDMHSQGFSFSIVNALTQNLAILLCGIPACVIFFPFFRNQGREEIDTESYLLACIFSFFFFTALYLLMPYLARKVSHPKLERFTGCLSAYTVQQQGLFLVISLLRYAVFCLQFLCMLYFFDVRLSSGESLLAIPTNYLFVTITPSFAFSEAALRASYAVATIGVFSENTLGIAIAGISIWFINTVLPMLPGSYFLTQKKSRERS